MWTDLWDLVIPRCCGGCGGHDTRWCDACADELLRAAPRRWAGPQPPADMPPTIVTVAYDGHVAQALRQYKDAGRGDLMGVLADPLAAALLTAVHLLGDQLGHQSQGEQAPWVTVVPSSSRATRQRGGAPVADLARRATQLAGVERFAPVLRSGRVRDQAGLGRHERADNVRQTMRVSRRHCGLVAARPWVVIDDIVTTGATLAEAARALRAAGASRVVAAAIAETRKRNRPGPQ